MAGNKCFNINFTRTIPLVTWQGINVLTSILPGTLSDMAGNKRRGCGIPQPFSSIADPVFFLDKFFLLFYGKHNNCMQLNNLSQKALRAASSHCEDVVNFEVVRKHFVVTVRLQHLNSILHSKKNNNNNNNNSKEKRAQKETQRKRSQF